tara:strand:+ start:798 stop:1022 length:225 start_codon:yes stop_codon:yes gene_type:complete
MTTITQNATTSAVSEGTVAAATLTEAAEIIVNKTSESADMPAIIPTNGMIDLGEADEASESIGIESEEVKVKKE